MFFTYVIKSDRIKRRKNHFVWFMYYPSGKLYASGYARKPREELEKELKESCLKAAYNNGYLTAPSKNPNVRSTSIPS